MRVSVTSREAFNRDLELNRRVIFRSAVGGEYARKPGRRKKLSAAQAATIFELQVQIRANQVLIEKILDKAGVNSSAHDSRLRILRLNWLDRGRIDVIRSSRKSGDGKPRVRN